MEERIFTVYQFIFPDGKMYFGCTKHPKIRHTPAQYARMAVGVPIRQYGLNNTIINIIADHLSKADAYKIEDWLIERYDTINPEKGWNRVHGNRFSSLIVGENAKSKGDKFYRAGKKEDIKIYNKEYYESHKDEILIQHKQSWSNRTPEQIARDKETHKRWQQRRKQEKQQTNTPC